jgi:hypothetical protein
MFSLFFALDLMFIIVCIAMLILLNFLGLKFTFCCHYFVYAIHERIIKSAIEDFSICLANAGFACSCISPISGIGCALCTGIFF